MPAPRLFLIDSFGFIFRAYHARARSGAPPMRTADGRPTEAVYIFNNMLRKLIKTWNPEYLAAVFETDSPGLRAEEFAEYKANRVETPRDLIEQIPMVRQLLEAMSVPVVEAPGYEADDVIGTFARAAEAQGLDVVIVSSDKDLMQLVSPRISMLNPAKEDAWYDPAGVKEFLGVPPEQVADLLALKGDAVDNIPGAPGIGDKGARDLLAQFGSVEAAIERAAEVQRKMYRESLVANQEQIRMSKRLATVHTNAPVAFEKDALALRGASPDALRAVYQSFEFHGMLRELGPAEDARQRDFRVLESAEEAAAILSSHKGPWAVWFSGDGKPETLPGELGLSPGEGRGFRLRPEWAAALLRDATVAKIACDVKGCVQALRACGIAASGIDEDLALYSFLLDADPNSCDLGSLCENHLRRTLPVAPEQRAEAVAELAVLLGERVKQRGLRKLYDEVDFPLIGVLDRMESTGISIDSEELKRLSALMTESIGRLTEEIHQIAGHPFNIASPQQLAKILFEEMAIQPPYKAGRGKSVSTAADVLEELAPNQPIAAKVLEFRQLSKLKGTYVDTLPELMDPETRRIHTTFNPVGAATGRLSSSNPNLQNIPIRTALGREIRAAFVPRPGWTLVVADYSQIELRLLAHFSKDPVLVEAFRNGEDIHARTAAEVMNVSPLLVTPEMRRAAKAVNFGIVYGISGFGLAAQLGIPRSEAERYIQAYFARYAGVRQWLDAAIAATRESGVTRTLFGRERPIPDIKSANASARGFAERTAVNSPLQGTAADLIKIAMIRIDGLLRGGGWQSAMLLQVHDELVFEAPPGETGRLREMVKREMEGVAALEVPLVADTGEGANWRDAK